MKTALPLASFGRKALLVGVSLLLLAQLVPAAVIASHTAAHNTAPVITAIADKTIAENSTLQFEITGSDADGDNIIFEIINKPTGAVFQQNTTTQAYFKWKPTFSQAGLYAVTIKLRDEYTADFEDFNVTVTNLNRAPDVAFLHNKFIDELAEFDQQMFATDPDGDTLVLSLESNVTDVGALPFNVNFADGGDGQGAMEWIPDCSQGNNDPTLYRFWFNATDGTATRSRSFQISVFDVNAPPVIEPVASLQALEGDVLSFRINATSCDPNQAHYLDVGLMSAVLGGINPPPVPMPFPNADLPVGVTIDTEDEDYLAAPQAPMYYDSIANLNFSYFNWTIGYQQTGNYTFYAEVTDELGEVDNLTFIIFIDDFNTAPLLTIPVFHDVPNSTYFGVEDTKFNQTDLAGVGGCNSLKVSLLLCPAVTIWTATVFDAENDTVYWNLDWTDLPGDNLPQGLRFNATGRNNVDGSDDSANGNPPLPAPFSSATIEWIPSYIQAGTYHFTIWVSDGDARHEIDFTICIENLNRRPYIDPIAPIVVFENEEVVQQVAGFDHDFQDPTFSDDVELTGIGLPPGSQFQDGHVEDTIFFEGTFRWVPGYHQAGVYLVTIAADDWDADEACPNCPVVPDIYDVQNPPVVPVPPFFNNTRTFSVTVLNVDRPPVMEPVADVVVMAGNPVLFPVFASDLDLDPITLSAAPLPAGASFVDLGIGEGTFSWTPTIGQFGTYTVVFTACSGVPLVCDSESMTIIVVEDADFELSPVGPVILATSPGVTITVTALVENTAPSGADIISFDVTVTNGGVGTVPASVFLVAGTSTTVSFDVTVPATASQFIVSLIGTSAADPALVKVTKWRVDVPIVVGLTMTSTVPLLVAANVVATYLDASPAVGVAIRVTQSPAVNPFGLLTSSVSGASDGSGGFDADFTGDVAASVPGGHTITANANYFGRSYSTVSSYSVP